MFIAIHPTLALIPKKSYRNGAGGGRGACSNISRTFEIPCTDLIATKYATGGQPKLLIEVRSGPSAGTNLSKELLRSYRQLHKDLSRRISYTGQMLSGHSHAAGRIG